MTGGGAGMAPQRVCFFGTYARGYTVTRTLLQACRAAGLDVLECNDPLWEETRTKDRAYFGVANMVRLVAAYSRCAVRLARRLNALPTADCYLVGFQGQVDMLLLRWFLRRRGLIVFAPLVTVTETLVDDREVYAPASLRALLARWLDRESLRAATRVVIDTQAHRHYLGEIFGIPESKTMVWHLGCDVEAFPPRPPCREEGVVRVLFYGSFLPLHGTQTILEAAALLAADEGVRFELVGEGPAAAAAQAFVRQRQLHNVRLSGWCPYLSLVDKVAVADICLGAFGDGRKAELVIPNKVYQSAAVGRAIITADTQAVREVFTHAETIWLCPAGDPQALADAIRVLCDDVDLRLRLGRNAAALMAERFAPARQGQQLAHLFADACLA
jgi:glycosyltransferase involved in cell wall biosynthesis